MPAGAIVIDNGSGYIKAGFASDSTPKVVFSSVMCFNTLPPPGSNKPRFYFDDDAIAKSDQLINYKPMYNCIIFQCNVLAALHGFDRKTGLVLECGNHLIAAVPIINDNPVPKNTARVDAGGLSVTLQELYENIILAGGGTLFSALTTCNHLAWIGAAKSTTTPEFANMSMKRAE
ncbi:hypothetical protein BDF19DRAFT_422994 [Syncephalis fuscata]|nr:hypothetical protein BDF19DRAFT_422994 [Syncephalis fuscata]